MIRLSIKTDFTGIKRQLDAMSSNMQASVVPMALNRVAAKAKTDSARRITQEFNLKSGEVKSQIEISKASRKLGIFEVSIQPFGRRHGHISRNVMMFAARPTKPTGYKMAKVNIAGKWVTMKAPVGGGVSVQIKKGQRKVIHGAFIANKGRTVFIRTGKDRLPIKGVETIDVPSMFNKRTINAAVIEKIKHDMPIEFNRAIQAAIARIWK